MRMIKFILSLLLMWLILRMALFIVCSCGIPEEACLKVGILVGGRMWLHLSIHWCLNVVWSEEFSRRAKLLLALTTTFMGAGFAYLAIELGTPML